MKPVVSSSKLASRSSHFSRLKMPAICFGHAGGSGSALGAAASAGARALVDQRVLRAIASLALVDVAQRLVDAVEPDLALLRRSRDRELEPSTLCLSHRGEKCVDAVRCDRIAGQVLDPIEGLAARLHQHVGTGLQLELRLTKRDADRHAAFHRLVDPNDHL